MIIVYMKNGTILTGEHILTDTDDSLVSGIKSDKWIVLQNDRNRTYFDKLNVKKIVAIKGIRKTTLYKGE